MITHTKTPFFILIFHLALFACASTPSAIPTPQPTPTLTPLHITEVEHSGGLVIALQFDHLGRLYYATQGGTITRKDSAAQQGKALLRIPVTRNGYEDGLLGFTLAPDFPSTLHFYTYHTVPDADNNPAHGEINRYRLNDDGTVSDPTLIFALPTTPEQLYHFGGGLSFGPDGRLYLILGDNNQPFLARSSQYLPGSILRLNPDGSIPADNPFGSDSAVYATGFRNGFALAWDPTTGDLYQAENGNSCDDELNLIQPAADYGWGRYEYDTCPYPDDVGQAPLYQWDTPVAPSAMLFYTDALIPEFRDKLLICAINHNHIYLVDLADPAAMSPLQIGDRDWFCQAALAQAPDGSLYTAMDDKIWKIGR